MNKKRILASVLLSFVLLPALAQAQLINVASMKNLAYALAWIMMVLMGVKWIIADSPNERAEAKKGMIYIVIGLLVVVSAGNLLCLYCKNAETALGAGASVCPDVKALISDAPC